MAPSSSTVLLAAGSAVTLLAAAAAFSSLSSSSSSNSVDKDSVGGATDIVEYEEEDYITEDLIVKIFDRLFIEMQAVVVQLSQQVQAIQMSGQQIPEQQLRQLLKAEFERALQQRQIKVYEELDVDEECVKEATWEFISINDEDEAGEKHIKVKKAVERFQKLYENISGESIVGLRPGGPKGSSKAKDGGDDFEILDETKLVEAAEVYFNSLTKTMEGIVTEFKSNGKNLSNPKTAQELHMAFAAVANDNGEESLKSMNISLKQFQASVEKHSQNPSVARSLTMLQMKQQQDMMAMGVPQM